MTKAIVDLHAHLTDAIHQGTWFNGKPHTPVERCESLARQLLKKSFSTADSTLVGIIDFDDHRAERTFEALKRNSDDSKQDGNLLSVYDENKAAHYLKGQEIPTNKGHLLVLGAKSDVTSRTLRDAINEAKDLGGIVIADHPLFNVGPLQQAALRLIKHPSQLSVTARELYEFKDSFDAMEIMNGNLSKRYTRKQDLLSFDYDIPGIATSDSHTVDGVFSVNMEMANLDFSDEESLKDSLKREFRRYPRKINGSYNGMTERLRHTAASFYENLLFSTGLVKKF